MKKLYLLSSVLLLSSCLSVDVSQKGDIESIQKPTSNIPTLNNEYYRGFSLNNVLISDSLGDIHYNVMVPSTYTGENAYALFFTLPGYQGLYRFGVGMNLMTEDFAFQAQKYVQDMIIVAPQLNDWGETSARQTIELVHYFKEKYNIDSERVFAEGYSGGGETMSIAMGIEPSLFTGYLHCSASFDGNLNVLCESQTPVYLVIGENDEYYGSTTLINTYNQINNLYKQKELDEQTISKLVTLDIKNSTYFSSSGITNQHGRGGYLFCRDENIMNWLFN